MEEVKEEGEQQEEEEEGERYGAPKPRKVVDAAAAAGKWRRSTTVSGRRSSFAAWGKPPTASVGGREISSGFFSFDAGSFNGAGDANDVPNVSSI